MRKGYYTTKQKAIGKHSLRCTNYEKIATGERPSKFNRLGQRIKIGFEEGDFANNRYTLKQFVKIPRIFA